MPDRIFMPKDIVDHWCLFVEDLGLNFASLHQDLDIRSILGDRFAWAEDEDASSLGNE